MSATIQSKSASQIITSGKPPTPTFNLFIHSLPPQAARNNEVREWLLTWYTGSSNDELIIVSEVLNRVHLTGMQLRELSHNALVWHLEAANMGAKWAKKLSEDIERAKEVEMNTLENSLELPTSHFTLKQIAWYSLLVLLVLIPLEGLLLLLSNEAEDVAVMIWGGTFLIAIYMSVWLVLNTKIE